MMGLAVYADRSARNLAAPIGHSAIKVQRYTDGLFVFILVIFALDQNVGSYTWIASAVSRWFLRQCLFAFFIVDQSELPHTF